MLPTNYGEDSLLIFVKTSCPRLHHFYAVACCKVIHFLQFLTMGIFFYQYLVEALTQLTVRSYLQWLMWSRSCFGVKIVLVVVISTATSNVSLLLLVKHRATTHKFQEVSIDFRLVGFSFILVNRPNIFPIGHFQIFSV